MISIFTKSVSWLNTFLRWISGGMLAGLLIILLAQIGLRTFQMTGFSWGNELTTYLMVWTVCLGLAVAFFEGTHLRVDLILSRLGRARPLVEGLATISTIAFLGILIYYGWAMVVSGMQQTSPALGLPMGYVYMALPVAGAVGILNIVASIFTDKQPVSQLEEEVKMERDMAEDLITEVEEDLETKPTDQERHTRDDDVNGHRKGRSI